MKINYLIVIFIIVLIIIYFIHYNVLENFYKTQQTTHALTTNTLLPFNNNYFKTPNCKECLDLFDKSPKGFQENRKNNPKIMFPVWNKKYDFCDFYFKSNSNSKKTDAVGSERTVAVGFDFFNSMDIESLIFSDSDNNISPRPDNYNYGKQLCSGRVPSDIRYYNGPTNISFLVKSKNGGSPTKPTGPTQPTQPTEPTGPTQPTQPTEPTEPTKPTGPTKPTEPTEPTEPTKPTGPTKPTKPTEPTEPTKPT